MASYAEILKDDGKKNENTSTNINTKSNSSSEKVKPVFLKDEDVLGSSMKPINLNFFREYSLSRP
jgi:hypothetical protein